MAATKSLIYVGPFDEVEIVGVGVVRNGVAFEVPARVADGLLRQVDNYKPASKSKES